MVPVALFKFRIQGSSDDSKWQLAESHSDKFVPFENLIGEDEALKMPPCNSFDSVVNPSKSSFKLAGKP